MNRVEKIREKIVEQYMGHMAEINQKALRHDLDQLKQSIKDEQRISVKDKLPNYYKLVIGYSPENKGGGLRSQIVWFARDDNGNGIWTRWDARSCPNITHWEPLPQPPKG